MAAVYRGKDSDIEFNMAGLFPEDWWWVCVGCPLEKQDVEIRPSREAFAHLVLHLHKGHLVPDEAFRWVVANITSDLIVHRGLHHGRCHLPGGSGPREFAFASEWLMANPAILGTGPNDGDTLAALLCRQVPGKTDHLGLPARQVAIPVTQEIATACATVVQWLGTNVGWCFLESALRRAGYSLVKNK